MGSVKENNKLIAEFMGIEKSQDFDGYLIDCISYHATQLDYHSSWDWLMSVIQKIYKTEIGSIFGYNGLIRADIDKTYKSVIKFIKIYNKEFNK